VEFRTHATQQHVTLTVARRMQMQIRESRRVGAAERGTVGGVSIKLKNIKLAYKRIKNW